MGIDVRVMVISLVLSGLSVSPINRYPTTSGVFSSLQYKTIETLTNILLLISTKNLGNSQLHFFFLTLQKLYMVFLSKHACLVIGVQWKIHLWINISLPSQKQTEILLQYKTMPTVYIEVLTCKYYHPIVEEKYYYFLQVPEHGEQKMNCSRPPTWPA